MELTRVESCCRGWARGSRAPLAWGDPRPLEVCPEPPLLVVRPLLPSVMWGSGAWGPLLVLQPLLPSVMWGGGAWRPLLVLRPLFPPVTWGGGASGPLLVGAGQVVGASFRAAGLAGPLCTGDRVLGAVGPAWRVTLAAVDASSAWRAHTVPRAAPRAPGRQERCERLGLRCQGLGVGSLQGPRAALSGVCVL